ncbi:ShlB/FhaC/HecB family hemolysin secretion/activation protein [Rhodospirillum centenum]|uniref:Hemolysin activation n=1 Tax=Rhodospirillum centenum (strain ATCC 51521 / SW) TaxID=414684 RepID=B6ISD3_RHOCS|nr:ShlB/FhaC/HecB family hemolysin secretion/activation protein [Rhodospirillum centenum]ACI98369.1 hemolysin activation [Rhodospirillum centenum SW]
MQIRKIALAAAAMLMTGASQVALGQDAGQILRDVERNIPKAPPPTPSVPGLAPAMPDDDFLKDGQTVRVTGFRIQSSLIPEKELAAQLTDYVGRDCTLGDLKEAAARISRYYAKRDLLARAVLPRQSLEGGIVTIQVLEARMGRVKIDPSSNTRLDPARAEAFIHARNPAGDAVRPGAIAAGVTNLGIIPGMQAVGILDAGEEEGTTDVILKMQEPPLVTGLLVLDNNSASEIGRARALGIVTMTDASGFGEQASLIAQVTKSSRYGQVSAGAPFMDGAFWLEGSGAALTYDIPRSVNTTQPAGNAQTAGLTARWLGLQASGEPVNLSVGVEHKWTSDKVGGLTTASNRLAALTFSARRVMRDQWQGGGAFILDGAVKIGNVDLSGNASNKALDRATADTQGNYAKLTLSAARRQALWQGGDLQITLSGQLASKNLNSAEQFSLGGLNGTRGYPVNAGSGDQGAMLGVELGHMLRDDLRGAIFWDGGLIEQHKERWTGWEGLGSPHNTYFQHNVGASVQWELLDNVQLETTLAKRVGPDAGRGLDLRVANERRSELRAWIQLVLAV